MTSLRTIARYRMGAVSRRSDWTMVLTAASKPITRAGLPFIGWRIVDAAFAQIDPAKIDDPVLNKAVLSAHSHPPAPNSIASHGATLQPKVNE